MSYATALLATHANMLGTLLHLVDKASGHHKGEALLHARLAEDMFPLATQIRFTVTQVIVALDRLGNLGIPSLDESEIQSFADARKRIAEAQAMVADTDPANWPAADAIVDFDLPNGMAFTMQAHEYVRDWALPQFYFHLMATYAILRMEGLPLGNADFMGFMMRHARAPETPASA